MSSNNRLGFRPSKSTTLNATAKSMHTKIQKVLTVFVELAKAFDSDDNNNHFAIGFGIVNESLDRFKS